MTAKTKATATQPSKFAAAFGKAQDAVKSETARSIGSDMARGAAITLGVVATLETIRAVKGLMA